jgi:hypothetical protein
LVFVFFLLIIINNFHYSLLYRVFFINFRSGQVEIEKESRVSFTKSKKYDILKADERKEIIQITSAMLA